MARSSVLVTLILALGLPLTCSARDMSLQELEDWFNDDTSARIAAVNEGELVFLASPPAKPVHHHHNILTVDDRTVDSGGAASVP
ncbi:MAG: hypothetical protein WHV61_04035 [Burkholderiales bacterium]